MTASAQSASAECDMPSALEGAIRQLAKQSCGAFGVTRSCCIFIA
jgi:hypothetical protein